MNRNYGGGSDGNRGVKRTAAEAAAGAADLGAAGAETGVAAGAAVGAVTGARGLGGGRGDSWGGPAALSPWLTAPTVAWDGIKLLALRGLSAPGFGTDG